MNKKLNIAPEGYSIIMSIVLFVIVLNILDYLFNISFLNILNIILSLFLLISLYFFRDPNRIPKQNNATQFLSPADGQILSINKIKDQDVGDSFKIAIFLSFFNVHRQWIPSNAKVLDVFYNPGKFFGAFKDKASINNEQTSIVFENIDGHIYKVKQIAGFVARRIVNHMKPNSLVSQGDKLGFIRFGSRVEIIVPSNFILMVNKGEKVKGCRTVIGKFSDSDI